MYSGSVEAAQKLVDTGNDFASIACYFHGMWGMDYQVWGFLVAEGWAMSVPCVGLWASCDSHREDTSATERWGAVIAGMVGGFGLSLACYSLMESRVVMSYLPLVARSSAIAVGVQWRKNRPLWSRFLIAFALTDHFIGFHAPIEALAEWGYDPSFLFASEVWLMSVPLAGMGVSLWRTDDEVDRLPV